VSRTTVTATVLDTGNGRVAGQAVVMFAPFDPAITFSPAQDNQDGTYTATLTSSHFAETTPIFAAAGAAVTHPATLTQLAASTASLTAVSTPPVTSSSPPVTNQSVTLSSTITSIAGTVVPPSGTVEFDNGATAISGCGAVPIPAQSGPAATVSCATTFAAPASPTRLVAVFHPSPGALVRGATSQVESFPVGRALTSVTVASSDLTPRIGSAVTYTAVLAAGEKGPIAPTGQVVFADHGHPIKACAGQPIGAGSIARCRLTYRGIARHAITAAYGGDASFNGSGSAILTLAVRADGALTSTMQWAFLFAPGSTRVLRLTVYGVGRGSRVIAHCRGHGCPFTRRAVAGPPRRGCGATGHHRCAIHSTIDLTRLFGGRGLAAGARLTVAIVRPGWIGKAYTFSMRSGRSPRVRIACTVPGSAVPGGSCTP
jgi:hypothetical protein